MTRLRGNCNDMDPEIFFPLSPKYTRSIQASKGACWGGVIPLESGEHVVPECPLIVSCLQWALNNREDSGTWGGYTEWERKGMLGMSGRKRFHIIEGEHNGARTGLMAELAST